MERAVLGNTCTAMKCIGRGVMLARGAPSEASGSSEEQRKAVLDGSGGEPG